MKQLSLLSTSIAALALSSCVAQVTFDPVGTADTVAGSWTVQGQPASVATCSELGIDYVRVRFYRGDHTSDHPALVFPCERGAFDTSPERVVASGTWTMALVAIDADGNTISLGAQETIETAAVGGHIVLTSVDFDGSARFDPSGTSAAVSASWTIGGAGTGSATCGAVSGSTVDVILYAASDSARTSPATIHSGIACADGSWDSGAPILAAGDYLASAKLRGPAGELLSTDDLVEPITITADTPVSLAFDFRFERPIVQVTTMWDAPASGTPTSCAAAGVGRMSWHLDYVDAGGTVTPNLADSGGEITCAERVTVTRATLAPGTYRLYFEGKNGAGAPTLWTVQPPCEATLDADGGLAFASCEAAYSGP